MSEPESQIEKHLKDYTNKLAAIVSLLERRQSVYDSRGQDLQITPGDTRTISCPPGSGGVVVDPHGVDMSVLTFSYSGITFVFPTSTTTTGFIPLPGNVATISVKNTSSSTFYLAVLVVSMENAKIFSSAAKG